ncbi:leucine-rich repeat protein [Gordonibacter sp.]|uniref:leucine-rich repeat protein n=1 Tax=Gordonibacter sp. TaxID=1968902 RepID=UPI0025C25F66|nr:leucine-rich repeat protein [Gordonibacter sp.]
MYEVCSDGVSVALVGWYGTAPTGTITVPAQVISGADSYTVTSVKSFATEGSPADLSAESLALPDTISDIADGAFNSCPSLARITINSQNENLMSFDGMVFTKDMAQLLSIPEGKEGVAHIPDPTSLVPASAFSRCVRLSRIEVGEGNANFTSWNGVLYSKDKKTLIAYPPGVGTSAVIPADVEALGPDAFAGCEALASIAALGFVRDIDSKAFPEEVKASAVVALPSGEDYDARKAVWEKAGFGNFSASAKPGDTVHPGADSSDGQNKDDEKAASGFAYTLLDDYTLSVSWEGSEDPAAELEIPATAEVNGASYRVSSVAANGFSNRASITSVKLPDGVTSIDEGAFAGCTSLASVTFPEGLRDIGARAFEATALTDVWLPASVTSVDSRAFAACGSLTRVVALATPAVAEDVLAGCTGVSVYCPYNAEGSYPWIVGLPSAGNHLLPYGVELAADPLSLETGQEADLLEGGLLEVPEPVETSYSYAASPLSVDAGTVSAKKAGATDVTAVLSLDGEELARSSRTVEVAAGPDDDEDLSGSDIPMINKTESLIPGIYLAEARASAVNVTAPIAVTFGGAGYDVSKAQSSLTASATFQNNTDTSVTMTKIDCNNQGAATLLEATSGTLDSQKLFSLYPGSDTAKAVSFGYGTGVNSATPASGAFDIAASDMLDCTFRLNLSSAKVKASAADGGATVQSLANVSYTFEANESFYLLDKASGTKYDLTTVKAHAADISSKGTGSSYYSKYNAYIADDSKYECWTKWGGVLYEVRIIGIYHDEKTSGGKAGLTFQFKNLLNTTYRMNSTNTNTGGWGASELRARMNPGTDSVANGTDDNAIWNQVPSDLQNAIAPVKKYYGPTYSSTASTVSTSNDSLFLASYREHSNTIYSGGNYAGKGWISAEGSQYEYWQGKVPNNYAANASLVKGLQATPSTAVYWWERSVNPNNDTNFLSVGTNGDPTNGNYASVAYGGCPCFCL